MMVWRIILKGPSIFGRSLLSLLIVGSIIIPACSHHSGTYVWSQPEGQPPVIIRSSPDPGTKYYEGDPIVFDASDSYSPDGGEVDITWYRNGPEGTQLILSTSEKFETSDLEAGDYAITTEARSGQLTATEVFILRVNPRKSMDPDQDSDGDGMPDGWEMAYSTDPKVKDADKDYDNDGYSNFEEYMNHLDPMRPDRIERPKPPRPSRSGISFEARVAIIGSLAVLLFGTFIFLFYRHVRSRSAVDRKIVRKERRLRSSRRDGPIRSKEFGKR